jgi:tRNA(Ile2) C34 agmatinyltransferase TiaS
MATLLPRKNNSSRQRPILWRRRKPKAKALRVAAITTDQFVLCPECGDPMKLFEMLTFECKGCGYKISAERVCEAVETN